MNILNAAKILGRRSRVYKGTIKQSTIASGLRKFTFWLTSLSAFLFFSAGIFWLQATRAPRTDDPDQARLAAENVPNQDTASLAQAIQALSRRH